MLQKLAMNRPLAPQVAPKSRPPAVRAALGDLVWRFVAVVTATAALLFGLVAMTVSQAQARSAPESFADLAEALLPAVVNISTTQERKAAEGPPPEMPQFPPGSPFEDFFKDFFERQQREGGAPRKATSLGSGFIIDSAGYVVTNNHVIEGADEIRVIFHDNETATAEIVGRDQETDLALLKVKTKKRLKAVKWGKSKDLRVGDWVLAIGNPFGFGGTVTAGIVSGRQRDINAGPYDNFIQTDASINRGNSGGPLFNTDGEVVGINTAIISPSGGSIGLGFAVPSAMASGVIDQLRKFGRPRRGWLGVRIQSVTDEIAESLGLDKPRGALVANVIDDGPAKSSGVKQGDVIIKLSGKDVPDSRKLVHMVGAVPVGDSINIVVWRDGKEMELRIKIGERPRPETQEAKASDPTEPGTRGNVAVETLGLSLSPITDKLRSEYGLSEDIDGVLVTGVSAESHAAEKDLRKGDVILEAGQKEVTKPEHVQARVQEALKQGSKSILLLVQRGNTPPRYYAVRVEKS